MLNDISLSSSYSSFWGTILAVNCLNPQELFAGKNSSLHEYSLPVEPEEGVGQTLPRSIPQPWVPHQTVLKQIKRFRRYLFGPLKLHSRDMLAEDLEEVGTGGLDRDLHGGEGRVAGARDGLVSGPTRRRSPARDL